MTIPNPADLTDEQMCAALTAGAAASDWLPKRAAAHLLTFLDLPGRPTFAPHVELWEDHPADGSAPMLCAAVTSWPDLINDDKIYFTSTAMRFVRLAAALDAGVEVDLRDALSNLGAQHARRAIEAVIIAAAAEGNWQLIGAPSTATLADPPR